MAKVLGSFGELASELAALAVSVSSKGEALAEIGEHLAEKAREKVGHQQDGWAPLAAATEAEKARHGYPQDAPLLRTGGLRGSISSRLVDHGEAVEVGTVSKAAVFHEFGTSKMPPRPVFAPLVSENVVEIHGILARHIASRAE
jgi:phage gpG-like protein